MSIPGFGNIMPIHGAILSLVGWQLTRGRSFIPKDENERLTEMRSGHAELVSETGVDFGFDVNLWRELLLSAEEFGYRHPYAFDSVDRAVRAAIADPEFARLRTLAESRTAAG
jgi:hypothetical protein